MSDTPHLGLPTIAAAQAQKHVTHNEALRTLDALVMLAVIDRDLTAPPASPAEGDRFLVKATGTGAFAGKDDQIAHYCDGGWRFCPPQAGWVCYVIDESILVAWNGSAWSDVFAAISSLQNLGLLGIGTTADATNPLSAKLNNALWTAKTVAEGGDGTLRYKLSKESAAKTLSLLFQDDYSGRAEIGLTGDDDFHVKVSADGTTWYEGLKIDHLTGKLSFPVSGGPREVLGADRTYYVRTDGSDSNTGLTDNAGGAWATVQRALDVVSGGIDFAAHNVTIQIGDGVYAPASGVPVANISPWVGGGTLTIQGNAGTPANVLCQTIGSDVFKITKGALPGALTLKAFKVETSASGAGLNFSQACAVNLDALDFGTCAGQHLVCSMGANVTFVSNYTISGGATRHWNANPFSWVNCMNKTIAITGTPNFSSAFAMATFAYMNITSVTFSGSATGARYSVVYNGLIATGSGANPNYFPGNSAGSTATGGQYI